MRATALSILTGAAALLAAGLAVPSARAGNATGAYAPYEDLTEVLAVLTWHLRDDVYRFQPPKDPTGHDIYKLSLKRLESWQKRFPGRLNEVTTYARAEALERLREFAHAAGTYRKVADVPGSPLAEPARAGAVRSAAFAQVAAMPEDGPEFEAHVNALKRKLDAWGVLVDRYGGTPYQALALVEEERLERATVVLIVQNRRILTDGDETAERAARFLIEKHAESKNLPDHVLELGDLYAAIAREYAAQHERPLAFDDDEFSRRADRALEAYRKVATWDGAPEKPEGQARFAALEAWKATVLASYR